MLLLSVGLAVALILPDRSHAQAGPATARTTWHVVVDGENVNDLRIGHSLTADSLSRVVGSVLAQLAERGSWYASVDSVTDTPQQSLNRLTIYIDGGERVRVSDVILTGFQVVDANEIRSRLALRAGSVLDKVKVDEDVSAILSIYSRLGYALAEVDAKVSPDTTGSSVQLNYIVAEKSIIRLVDIELAPEIRSGKKLISRLSHLPMGRPLRSFESERVQAALLGTGLYRLVGEPEVRMISESDAVISLPLVEASPGSFDLVLGYLPGVSGNRGSLIGNGRLQLVNLFGGGRTLGVRLNRLPGQTSTVNVSAVDPFFLGLPIGIEFGFDGEQRDSTYGKQRYDAGLTYRVFNELELSGNVTRETTRPGQAGVAFRNNVQRISRADAVLAGIGITFAKVDDRINPRRGVTFESSVSRGSKASVQRRIVDADTVTTNRSFRQERLSASLRGYIPIATRHVTAIGVDAGLLRSDVYETSDLIRFGGANSLRGYNEEQFAGRFVNRWFLEYRYLLERASYAYVFVDIGIVEIPVVEGLPVGTEIYPGYGIGIQFETGIGIVNATYALNRDDGPANGKIHVGLSFAL